MSIDALIGRMEALLGPLEAAGDPRRYFHATYLRTTRAVRDALTAGLFSDPDWVERWDVAFASRYLDALRADSAGEAVPGPWAVAFRTARQQPSAPALRHVLLGMNAHINYDLPQALLTVISGAEFADLGAARPPPGRPPAHRRGAQPAGRRRGCRTGRGGAAIRGGHRAHPAQPGRQRSGFLREARAKVWDNTVGIERRLGRWALPPPMRSGWGISRR